jgi:hypothetical protein
MIVKAVGHINPEINYYYYYYYYYYKVLHDEWGQFIHKVVSEPHLQFL